MSGRHITMVTPPIGYAGLVVAAIAAAAALLVARRRYRVRWWTALILGLLSGLGIVAFWAYRAGSIGWVWWGVGGLAGAGLGGSCALGSRWSSELEASWIGDYRVEGVLGSGSSGTVYRAVDQAGAPVAIKVLDPEWMADTEFRERFRDEALVMRTLDHPNCVGVHDVFDDATVAAIVTDYVDGASLRVVLERAGRLDGPAAARVMSGALRGLAHVHERGMIHRDVKPENILVDRDGVSRLVDYGLARDVGQFAAGSEASVGSPAYMSPEQVRGDTLDPRSDVYACGAVLFELLTGTRPYTAGTVAEMAAAHLRADVPDPRASTPAVGEALATLTMSALAKQPADRPASAEAFYQALESAAERTYGPAWAAGTTAAGLGAATTAVGVTAGTGGAATAGGAVAGETVAGATIDAISIPAATASLRRQVPRRKPRRAAHAGAPSDPTYSGLSPRVIRFPERSAKRWLAPAAATVTAVAVILTLAGALSAHRSSGVAGLAACLPGDWIIQAGAGEDVWVDQPVLVHIPRSSKALTHFGPDGTFFEFAPPGEPPAVGTLHGAPFIDTGYGVSTGRWQAKGQHTLIESSIDRRHSVLTLYAGYEHYTALGFPLQTGDITRTVTCSAQMLVIADNFTYHGIPITGHMSFQRTSGRPHGVPTSSIPDQSALLGGVDLNRYCSAQFGAQGAVTTKPLTGPGDASMNWACQAVIKPCPGCTAGTSILIVMDAACQWAYPTDQNVVARAIDPNSAGSWLCYGGAPRTFTISPASGGIGTAITLVSVVPCPASTLGIQFGFILLPGGVIQFGGARPLAGGGAWSVPLTVSSGGPNTGSARIPAGRARVDAFCVLPNNKYAPYQSEWFQFTGG